MNVLVINCGSSSLKYQLIDSQKEHVLAVGLCERIGIAGSRLCHTVTGKEKKITEAPMPDHEAAIQMVLDALMQKECGVIDSLEQIDAVGHRIVHGGEHFAQATILTPEVIEEIERCNDLAPLHNPANLIGIRACQSLMPNTPMVGVFDTAFHQTIPQKAYLYGIPYSYYEKYKIRRYGFHGTSHQFVSQKAMQLCGLQQDHAKVIVCHLGNGASVTAVQNGKSVDTSMGLTPLEGLIMGTRSGDLDPAIIEFLMHKEEKSIDEMMQILNKQSGVLGLSTFSSDFRDLRAAQETGDDRAIRAMEAYVYRVAKYIGAYTAAMNGVDAIAFTAGLGENNAAIRTQICAYLTYLGLEIDEEKNERAKQDAIITTQDSKVKVCVIPTNEELAIARETVRLVK